MKRLLAVVLMMTMVISGCGGGEAPAEEASAGEGTLEAMELVSVTVE